MSLLLRDHMRIGLCPDRLVCASYRRGFRPTVAARDIIAVEPPRSSADWQPAVAALPSALALGNPGGVTVILSNHFVRYALLPWIPALRTEEEWLTLARTGFRSCTAIRPRTGGTGFGDDAGGPARGRARLTRGCSTRRVEDRRRRRPAPWSVQPYLMAAFNRIRPELGKDSCWLVIEEPGRLTLALIQNGAWSAIRSRRSDERWEAMLPETLQRESAVLGLEQPCAQVVVYTAQEAFNTDPDGAFHMRNLTAAAGAAFDDRKFAMVLG